MKIKKIGWTTFLITSNELSIITDPLLLKESGASFPKTEADVVLFTEYDTPMNGESILKKYSLDEKVVAGKRGEIIEIHTPGEYEVGGVMIRRGLYRDWETDRKSTRLNSSHITRARMPSSA